MWQDLGFEKCGATVHSSRCGWHAGWGAGGWHAGGWRAGGWHFNQVSEQNQTDDAVANVSTEVPSMEQEASPAPAQEGWDNNHVARWHNNERRELSLLNKARQPRDNKIVLQQVTASNEATMAWTCPSLVAYISLSPHELVDSDLG